MNISYGIITKNFTDLGTLEDFLSNADKYGHIIHSVIIAYSFECDFKLIERLQGRVRVELIKINQIENMKEKMIKLGVEEKHIDQVLLSKSLDECNMTTYGTNRNNVLVQAMLNKTDFLFFIDTDVYPHILIEKNGERQNHEIDFIGEHLKYLQKPEIDITTSDYSGYFIIPVMEFKYMENLFFGIQKEEAYNCVQNCKEHGCLNFGNFIDRKTFITNKVLGGNLGIKIASMKDLPPFFSGVLKVGESSYLTRGEDTLLGLSVNHGERKCIDIDLKIFHDTFNNYPFKPDIINDKKVRDRFFYACMGWIGRNPFLNWMHGKDVSKVYENQRKNLIKGEKALANYLDDDRFLKLSEALDISYGQVDKMIQDYENLLESWNQIKLKLL